jgi:hypothetical protein
VSWIAPGNGGSPITGYTITIGQSDNITFSSDITNCNQLNSIATSCTIPVTSLKSAPFSLPWGSSVYAKVIAINLYGNSQVSD